MQCPQCQHENSEAAKFCEECGTKLIRACPSCGQEVSPRAKFCPACGTSLTRQLPASQTLDSSLQTLDSSRPEAERRQLTVIFCDLVGSTALSERLDPEELREVVRAYQEVCTQVISRYEGHIAQYLGDGLLVYFGYPVAHEDDVQRAVRAGLEIVEKIHALGAPSSASAAEENRAATVRERPTDRLLTRAALSPLQVRIGIHTGLVVVGGIGGGGKREQLALGDTPNIAARVQGIAEPDTIVLSAATHRLIEGLFVCRDLGPHTLRGVSTPLSVYRVVGEGVAHSRFEVAVRTGLTPLVGREEELELLLRRWRQAREGAGQGVLLSGEAGIGKSRLVQVLRERTVSEGYARVEWRCSPYYQSSALYPVIDHVQRLLQFGREDSPEERLGKLEGRLAQYTLSLPELVPLLATLLSLPLPARYPPLTLTPQRQKQKTLEALLTWLLKEAERQPVLLIVEDLHWVDPSTLEFLSLLIDHVPAARILMLLAFRPDFHPPWAMLAHLTQLTLSRLARTQVEVMVEKVTAGKILPPEVVQQIVTKTDGVPLFVEELTKMVLESGLVKERDGHYELMGPLPLLAIPVTLQDSLMARLDRLATVREVAQLGATLGREFAYELIRAVSSLDETVLQQALGKLVEAELLYQRGLPPQARYLFKHALIQDAAYQSLLKSKRQQYHQQIAQVLEERFPEIRETQPELLAYHYTEAGFIVQAIPYWQRAGQRATQRSAYVEAIAHLTKGLELLKTLPDTPERAQQELDLQLALGPALIATKGYAAPEVERVYVRARELCQQVGETSQLFSVLWGLWDCHSVRAEHKAAHELGGQLLTLAQSGQDPAFLVEAYRALGVTLFWLGKLVPAREHIEQSILLYDSRQHRSYVSLYGQDPGVICLCRVALVLCYLGYPDQALKRSQEALTLAQELSHPFSLAYALAFAAVLHQSHWEWQAAQEWAEAVITLSADQGFPYWLAYGTIVRGSALAEQGQVEEGIAQIRQGLAALRVTGAEGIVPYGLALLAEAYGKAGQAEEGLTVLAEALGVVDKNEERYYEAELYRLKGTLMLQSKVQGPKSKVEKSPESEVRSPESGAEECFLKAIDIARRQSAKSLELRAVMSLARLWRQQSKKEEARQMLAEVYGWFTEGFDTADLKEAKALLEELT